PRAAGWFDPVVSFELLLRAMDLPVDVAELPLSQLVLVVLAAVAVRRRHRDFLRDPRALLVQEPAELLAQHLESRPRHVLLHGFLLAERGGAGNFVPCRPRSPRESASP